MGSETYALINTTDLLNLKFQISVFKIHWGNIILCLLYPEPYMTRLNLGVQILLVRLSQVRFSM